MLLSQGVQTRCDVARCSVDRGRCNAPNMLTKCRRLLNS
jgi:hypothetical protein